MDTSEAYIEMCEKAVEIQPQNLKEGDYYTWVTLRGIVFIWSNEESLRKKMVICLPRQDQLQEMMKNDFDGFVWYVDENYGNGVDEFHVNNDTLPSMEQLWLAFVMKERYGKVWNGTDWIKQK